MFRGRQVIFEEIVVVLGVDSEVVVSSRMRTRKCGRLGREVVRLAELMRERLYISWPLRRAVGE